MKNVLKQLKNIEFDPQQPLIICDVDEVILHFCAPFEEYLGKEGMRISYKSYALYGNIHFIETGELVSNEQISQVIDRFFDHCVDEQILVSGAAAALDKLSEEGRVFMLTNIPHIYAKRRIDCLKAQGISHSLISGSGPKGPVVQHIIQNITAPVVFIDDISFHLQSVAEHVPDSLRIQYIAHRGLNEIEEKSPDCHHRCQDWKHIETVIKDFLR